ncbi:hypothetical protein BVX97_04615 [bacterium E08(2017)]|nr:hypothetical protein BVX97_04615 [bacterium E08(2017)]
MKISVSLFVLVLVANNVAIAAGVNQAELADIVRKDGKSWGLTANEFMQRYGKTGFRWTSKTHKNSARVAKRGNANLSYMGEPVTESIAMFNDGKLAELIVSLYNRGDMGEIPKVEFQKKVSIWVSKLDSWTGVRSVDVASAVQAGGAKKESKVWTGASNQVKLEWSYSVGGRKAGFDFRPEYIKLQIQSSKGDGDYSSRIQAKRSMEGTVSRRQLKSNVVKDAGGDVFIDNIPMVDQGQKGYCAVATLERIMRYYGREVDQHEMAQVARTGTGGGTSMNNMVDALRKMGLSLGCKIIIHKDLDFKSFERMISDYNREAKKMGRKQISFARKGTIDAGKIYSSLEAEPWVASKVKKTSDFKKFLMTVKKYVNIGMPVVWTVYTGVLPEKPSFRGRGGHMRMIIGYNTKTSEIIYSDTWGAGHEKKRISMDHAWTMTDGLYTVEPRRLVY